MVRSELNDAIGLGACRLFGRDDRLLVLLVGLIFVLILVLRVLIRGLGGLILVLLFLVGFLGQVPFANALAIADAQHHHDVICFFLGQRVARDMPPVEIAFLFVAQQA